jgi:hypothetical protein
MLVGEPLVKSADFRIARGTLRGMKRIPFLVALLAAGVIAAAASASGAYTAKSVHLNAQNPRATFSVRANQPKKIILYIGTANVTTTTRCLKGTTVSKLSRSFHTDGTRNMLWHIAGGQDVCHVSVAATLKGQGTGYVSVDVYPR